MPSALGRSGSASRSPTEAPLGTPLFVLNLKSYPACLGPGAVRIATELASASRRTGVSVAVAPTPSDVGSLVASVRIPVLGQHVDPLEPGARTGWVVAESLAAAGARGSLVNHSEHPLPPDDVATAVARLDAIGLVAVVCAKDVEDARRLARTRPPYLAVEPPELIGGDVSVSTSKPEVVQGAVEAVRSVSPGTRVLCGAGIRDRNDVAIALRLGAEGVLVASAVTKAADPAEAISELLAGFPSAVRSVA